MALPPENRAPRARALLALLLPAPNATNTHSPVAPAASLAALRSPAEATHDCMIVLRLFQSIDYGYLRLRPVPHRFHKVPVELSSPSVSDGLNVFRRQFYFERFELLFLSAVVARRAILSDCPVEIIPKSQLCTHVTTTPPVYCCAHSRRVCPGVIL